MTKSSVHPKHILVRDLIIFTLSPSSRDRETLWLGKVLEKRLNSFVVSYCKTDSRKFTERAIIPFCSVRRIYKRVAYRKDAAMILLTKFGKDSDRGVSRNKEKRVNQVGGMVFKY